MWLLDSWKRRRQQKAFERETFPMDKVPSPETMFALNYSATQLIKEGDFAKHGFASQAEMVTAFMIVEILGASNGEMKDEDIRDLIGSQMGISPERCQLLIDQARATTNKTL
jgi:hypothetical protein